MSISVAVLMHACARDSVIPPKLALCRGCDVAGTAARRRELMQRIRHALAGARQDA